MVKIGDIELGEFPLLLAPMEDVSDPPFRALCKQQGADMMYTEFIAAEGLIRDAVKSVHKLDIFDYERPMGIQIFGDKIDVMCDAAAIAEAAGPEWWILTLVVRLKKSPVKAQVREPYWIFPKW